MRSRARQRRANAAVEFALLAPLLLILLGGIVEIGLLLRSYIVVNRLAMQYAAAYANCSDVSAGACGTELTQYGTTAALNNIVPQLVAANVTLSMAQAQMNGGAATTEYIFPSGGTLSAAQTTALQAAVASGQTGVVVTVTYTYALLMFTAVMTPVLGSTFTISYTAAQLK